MLRVQERLAVEDLAVPLGVLVVVGEVVIGAAPTPGGRGEALPADVEASEGPRHGVDVEGAGGEGAEAHFALVIQVGALLPS